MKSKAEGENVKYIYRGVSRSGSSLSLKLRACSRDDAVFASRQRRPAAAARGGVSYRFDSIIRFIRVASEITL